MMGKISGTYLERYKAVRLDTFAEYPKLISCDENEGVIEIPTPDGVKTITCAAGFKLVPKR